MAKADNFSFRPEKDYALFFANDDYSGHPNFKSLKNPVRDAQALAKELKEMYDFETRVYANYTKKKIFEMLESWQKKRFAPDAQLFIFFSGHGTFWDFTNNGYFVPNTKSSEYDAYIELKTLGNIVTKFNCDHIMLAIDACYSGTIDTEIAFKGALGRRPGQNANEKNRIVTTQLRNKSRLLITSGGKQRTPDGNQHSPFSYAIIKGLRNAYTNADGLFTFRDLLAQLERVSPTPHQGELVGHDGGGFVFVSEQINPQFSSNSSSRSLNSNVTNKSEGSFLDRDKNVVTYKRMDDGRIWTTKNLNTKISGSFCYDNLQQNCEKYGRLYLFSAAKQVCTTLGTDWRLPSDKEWEKLANTYGGSTTFIDGKSVTNGDNKKSHQALYNNGDSGFGALHGGWISNNNFSSLNQYGLYWSSTKLNEEDASSYAFWRDYFSEMHSDIGTQGYGHSVRCILDE